MSEPGSTSETSAAASVESFRPPPEDVDGVAAPGAERRALAVEVGGCSLLVPVDHVAELAVCGHIAPIPLTWHWVRGATVLGDRLLTVIDPAAFLDLAQTRLCRDARLLVPADRSLDLVLLVGRVTGLRRVGDDLDGAEVDDRCRPILPFISRMAVDDGVPWPVLDLGRLLAEPRLSRIGRCQP